MRAVVPLAGTWWRLDNTIRRLGATFGIRRGSGQGERFLARMQAAASIPGLSEPVASLLRARESLVIEIGHLDRQLMDDLRR